MQPGDICKVIAKDLKERGITHKELATMIGKTKSVVSSQISGKKSFSKEMASLFSRALGYNIKFLLYGEGPLKDDSIVRDIVSVPSGERGDLDISILAGLIQIAGDILYMTNDNTAIEAWNRVNNGDYQGYMDSISLLSKAHNTQQIGSSILVRYICEQIQSKLFILVRPTKL